MFPEQGERLAELLRLRPRGAGPMHKSFEGKILNALRLPILVALRVMRDMPRQRKRRNQLDISSDLVLTFRARERCRQ